MDDYPARLRYQGDVAEQYLDRRTGDKKWQLEQDAMARLIGALPRGSRVLDVPIGTGRYLPFYRDAGLAVFGLDISADMLRQVGTDADAARTIRGLVRGDVTRIPLRDGAIDYVVSTRLMNWLPFGVFAGALRELARVASAGLLLGIRETEPIGLGHLPAIRAELAAAPWASLRRLLRRIKVWGPPQIVLHPAAKVRAAMAEVGLTVDEVVTIDEGTAYSRRLFRYAPLRVYVLRR